MAAEDGLICACRLGGRGGGHELGWPEIDRWRPEQGCRGDVIAVRDSYGWIDSLRARYVSVVTRDGVEHLIPNEDLITNRVENWSYSNNLPRLRTPVGAGRPLS